MTAITCSCGHDARNHSPVGCQILINKVVCPCRRSSAEIAIERVEQLTTVLSIYADPDNWDGYKPAQTVLRGQ